MIESIKDNLTHFIVNEILKDRKREPFFPSSISFLLSLVISIRTLESIITKTYFYN